MKGRVFSYGDPCPCGGAWRDVTDGVTGDVINIVCEKCLRAPTRFAVDGRSFKNRKGTVGRLFRDERGELFFYFGAAHQKLQAIRSDWGNQGPERFDPTKWSRSGRESYKLAECAREWQLNLKERGASRGYLQHVELFFRLHIVPHLPADIDIRELVPDDVEKMQLALKAKNLSQNTVKNALTVLRTLLKRYHYRKMVLDKLIPFPEKWSATPDIDRETLTPDKQAIIIDEFDECDWLMMEVYADLGCRPEELCGFRRRDFLPGCFVEIQRVIDAFGELKNYTKTRKKRMTELRPDLHARVCALPLLPEAFAFTKDGKPFNPNRLSAMYRVRADKAGFPDTTLYTFARHSLVTRLKKDAYKKSVQASADKIGDTTRTTKLHYLQE